MDGLCIDLVKTVGSYLKASDVYLLNLYDIDSSEYLKLAKISSRCSLAYKNNDYHWIHQTSNIFLGQKLLFAVEYQNEPLIWYYFDMIKRCLNPDIIRRTKILQDHYFSRRFSSNENILLRSPDTLSELITKMLRCIYKNNLKQLKLLNLIKELFPHLDDHFNDPDICYWMGYHGRHMDRPNLDYLRGLSDGSHLELCTKIVLSDTFTLTKDAITEITLINDEDLAIKLLHKVNNLPDKDDSDVSIYYRRFLEKKRYKVVEVGLMNMFPPSSSILLSIVDYDKPEIINLDYLMMYPSVLKSVVAWYARKNQTEMIDFLFSNIYRHDIMIGVLYSKFPQYKDYAIQKFKNSYGVNAEIKKLDILYPPEIDTALPYNSDQMSKFENMDPPSLIRCPPIFLEDIIDIDSMELLRKTIIKMLIHDFNDTFYIFSNGYCRNTASYIESLIICNNMDIEELKSIQTQPAQSKSKAEIIIELANHLC